MTLHRHLTDTNKKKSIALITDTVKKITYC